MGAHRNQKLERSEEAHKRAAIIHAIKERLRYQQKKREFEQTQPRREYGRNNPHGGRYMPEQRKQPRKYKYECTDCGHLFNTARKTPRNGIMSPAARFAISQGGYALYCPSCDKERTYDGNSNPDLFQTMKDLIGF